MRCRALLYAAVLPPLILSLSACGESGAAPSRAAFVTRADRVCAHFGRAASRLPRKGATKQYVALLDQMIGQLDSIKPPDDSQERDRVFLTAMTQIRRKVDSTGGDAAKLHAIAAPLWDMADKAYPKALAVGLEDCARLLKFTPTPPSTLPQVPFVEGVDEQSARARLVRAGFRVRVIRARSSRPSALVLRQMPAGGVRARPKSEVTITVSSGAPKRTGAYWHIHLHPKLKQSSK
jgi:hypothetical protein